MRITFLLLLTFLSGIAIQAQQITGIIQDEQGKSLAAASVALKKNKDSSIVKLGISNSAGKYEFNNIPSGNYFIDISHVGYTPFHSTTFTINGEGLINVPITRLIKASAAMQEAVVTSRRPIVEVKADKIVLNVEGSVNAVGQDALDLLRKSPGVTVDKDNNLSLSGKNGVQVFIDGRPTPLSGQDLAEY